MSNIQRRTSGKSISGTRTSVQNGQLITSCGNPSLDHIIGGGMALGSLMLIEEDKFVTYSKVLAKYFLAEGVFCNHSIFLGSLDDEPLELMRKLPTPIEDGVPSKPGSSEQSSSINDEMRIAWRYNDLPKVNSEQTTINIGHNFDLTKQINEEILKNIETTFWDVFTSQKSKAVKQNIFKNYKYYDLLESITKILENSKFSLNSEISDDEKQILRICITSLGSPFWYDHEFPVDFIKFLTILKSIIRNSLAVCFITIPMNLIRVFDEHLLPRIRNQFEYSIELESFAGSDKETNPIFKEYHGLLNIKRITAINTLSNFTPETTDLAFKLRRKKFVIEKLHLPPELQESEQREQDDIIPSLGCGSTKKQLEF